MLPDSVSCSHSEVAASVDIFGKVWYLLWGAVDSAVSVSGESLSADGFLVEGKMLARLLWFQRFIV